VILSLWTANGRECRRSSVRTVLRTKRPETDVTPGLSRSLLARRFPRTLALLAASGHYEPTSETGDGHRLLSTPAGDVELRIPKLRVGSFFPSLLEPRRRVDKALWAVIMAAYVTGTS